MKKKGSSKLTLNRETLKQLDQSDLYTLAGATAQLDCPNTNTCKPTCQTCVGPNCIETVRGCPSRVDCTTNTQ